MDVNGVACPLLHLLVCLFAQIDKLMKTIIVLNGHGLNPILSKWQFIFASSSKTRFVSFGSSSWICSYGIVINNEFFIQFSK